MLPIVKAPSPILSQKAKPVKKLDAKTRSLIEKMKETLVKTQDPQGVGLAGPQVNESLRVFIAKPTAKSPILTFINPLIEQNIKTESPRNKNSAARKLEGCLSLQSVWGEVKRESQIVVSYTDESGVKHRKKISGFLATIIQHEMDHLNGILFPKRVLEQNGNLYKSRKNEKGEDEFEKIEI